MWKKSNHKGIIKKFGTESTHKCDWNHVTDWAASLSASTLKGKRYFTLNYHVSHKLEGLQLLYRGTKGLRYLAALGLAGSGFQVKSQKS